jgi:hypothetical protein
MEFEKHEGLKRYFSDVLKWTRGLLDELKAANADSKATANVSTAVRCLEQAETQHSSMKVEVQVVVSNVPVEQPVVSGSIVDSEPQQMVEERRQKKQNKPQTTDEQPVEDEDKTN